VAVLVNRAALAASLGDKASPDAIDKQVKEIEQFVTSAAGLRKDRGDAVKISVVDFVDAGKDLEPVPAPSFLEIVERQTGTLISAGVILLIAVLLILFGIRPVTRALLAPPPTALEALESPPERRWPSGSFE
jgi:flagellar M-ring protein FliF